jgi:anti-anti-sigma factor
VTTANVLVQADQTRIHIAITGEVDVVNATTVEEQIIAAVDNQATAVQLDLSNLDYLDSSGLRILFTLANRLRVLQIELDVIAPPGSPARRVLELAGFDAVRPLRSQPPASS